LPRRPTPLSSFRFEDGIVEREIRLSIAGIQNPEGAVHRNIVPPDNPITLKQAAELGLALLELAFEAQEMAKRDQQLDGLSDPAESITP
jgi:hypothetical protein